MDRGAWWATVQGGAESAQHTRTQCVAEFLLFLRLWIRVDVCPSLSVHSAMDTSVASTFGFCESGSTDSCFQFFGTCTQK